MIIYFSWTYFNYFEFKSLIFRLRIKNIPPCLSFCLLFVSLNGFNVETGNVVQLILTIILSFYPYFLSFCIGVTV